MLTNSWQKSKQTAVQSKQTADWSNHTADSSKQTADSRNQTADLSDKLKNVNKQLIWLKIEYLDKNLILKQCVKPDDFNAKKTEMNNSPFLVHFDNRDAIRQLIKKKTCC